MNGDPLELWNGATFPSDLHIRVQKTDHKPIRDFVYDIGLMLFVSAKALELITNFNVAGVESFRLTLVEKGGKTYEDFYWLNLKKSVSLLDREKSQYERSVNGRFRKVNYLLINRSFIPAEDLFVCEEISLPVFSGNLVSAIKKSKLFGAKFYPLQGSQWP